MMIEINGEVFYTAKDAANYLGIRRPMFYANVKPQVHAYQFASRRRLLYRQADLEPFRQVKVIASVA
jgi:hypothetical protein